jgi:single-stranded-DNA-specific exonuclease
LNQYGGHKYAAGLTLPIENVSAFQKKFEEVVANTISNDQLIPKINIDAELAFSDINLGFYNIIKQMGPFGPQNMQPLFVTHNVILKNKARILKDLHLKLLVEQKNEHVTLDVIGFNLAEFANNLDNPFSIAYTIEENNYRGNKTLQLMLKDIKVNNA